MKLLLFFAIALVPFFGQAQRIHGDLYLGVANYQGDLQNKRFTFTGAKPAVGLGLSYDLSNYFILRGSANYMTVTGDDKNNKLPQNVNSRNLSFESKILEAQLGIEYNLFDLSEKSLTPYIFGSVAAFHFNPYSFDRSGNKVFLRSLGTEGQGLSLYPEKKAYKNNQFAIPFGGGVKFALSENLQIGLEVGLRKIFTDYLDDVSGTYADSAALLAGRGPQAVAFAYRETELHGSSTYPAGGSVRGNPKNKDWYYTTGLRVSYLFGGGNGGSGRKTKTGCPTNIY